MKKTTIKAVWAIAVVSDDGSAKQLREIKYRPIDWVRIPLPPQHKEMLNASPYLFM